MDIHKGILVKEIDDQDNFIYPKSSSDFIVHGENEETTVKAELDKLNNNVEINTTEINNINNEIRDARLPSAGGDPAASLNDRLNTDFSHLKNQISTLGGQLSGDLNRITSLINTENRNTRLVISNYKEVSRARRASSDNKVKNTLNDRINTDYNALSDKMGSNYDELYNKERIMKKFLKKHIHEIKGSRTALSDNEYKYCLKERIDVDYRSISGILNNVNDNVNNINGELIDARTTTLYKRDNSRVTFNSIGARLDGDFVEVDNRLRIINDEIEAAINASTSDYPAKASLKGRLESDYSQLYLLLNNITNTVNDANTLISNLYLTAGQTYVVDHVFCIGMITTNRTRIACYIPTPPLIGVNNISTIASNLASEARIVVRVADTRGWLSDTYYNNIFINDTDGDDDSSGNRVYFKDAIEAAIAGNLSSTTMTFIPRKWGIEFRLDYAPKFDVVVNNQPVVVTFTNLKLKLT